MNEEIREIVENLGVKKAKKEFLENQNRLFKLNRLMSEMTFDRTVGLYAYYLDEILYLVSTTKKGVEKDKIDKIRELETKIDALENNVKVKEYADIRNEYYRILCNNDYFRVVNIGLREELSKIDMKDIYVLQSKYDFDRHIIDSSPLVCTENAILIEPVYNMESFRDFRHFYNKTSFKYLEAVSEDYSFDLEGKKLGKIKIKNFTSINK